MTHKLALALVFILATLTSALAQDPWPGYKVEWNTAITKIERNIREVEDFISSRCTQRPTMESRSTCIAAARSGIDLRRAEKGLLELMLAAASSPPAERDLIFQLTPVQEYNSRNGKTTIMLNRIDEIFPARQSALGKKN